MQPKLGGYGSSGYKSWRGSKIKDKEGLREMIGPITRAFLLTGVRPIYDGQTREGVGYPKDQLNRWMVAYKWAVNSENYFMNIIEELKTNYDGAAELWGKYEKQIEAFRSAIKNDVASLEASARKTTEAVQRMNKAYGDVITRMNGEEMLQAIANAERLATAMQALANLQPHKLTLAVIDQSNGAGSAHS